MSCIFRPSNQRDASKRDNVTRRRYYLVWGSRPARIKPSTAQLEQQPLSWSWRPCRTCHSTHTIAHAHIHTHLLCVANQTLGPAPFFGAESLLQRKSKKETTVFARELCLRAAHDLRGAQGEEGACCPLKTGQGRVA